MSQPSSSDYLHFLLAEIDRLRGRVDALTEAGNGLADLWDAYYRDEQLEHASIRSRLAAWREAAGQ